MSFFLLYLPKAKIKFLTAGLLTLSGLYCLPILSDSGRGYTILFGRLQLRVQFPGYTGFPLRLRIVAFTETVAAKI